MEVFVVLSLALAAAALGMVVVAVVVLRRQITRLTAALRETSEHVTTLAAELSEEAAVLSVETEALQRRMASRGKTDRAGYDSLDVPTGS
jgi:predicted PurR-regulated permease PerM